MTTENDTDIDLCSDTMIVNSNLIRQALSERCRSISETNNNANRPSDGQDTQDVDIDQPIEMLIRLISRHDTLYQAMLTLIQHPQQEHPYSVQGSMILTPLISGFGLVHFLCLSNIIPNPYPNIMTKSVIPALCIHLCAFAIITLVKLNRVNTQTILGSLIYANTLLMSACVFTTQQQSLTLTEKNRLWKHAASTLVTLVAKLMFTKYYHPPNAYVSSSPQGTHRVLYFIPPLLGLPWAVSGIIGLWGIGPSELLTTALQNSHPDKHKPAISISCLIFINCIDALILATAIATGAYLLKKSHPAASHAFSLAINGIHAILFTCALYAACHPVQSHADVIPELAITVFTGGLLVNGLYTAYAHATTLQKAKTRFGLLFQSFSTEGSAPTLHDMDDRLDHTLLMYE